MSAQRGDVGLQITEAGGELFVGGKQVTGGGVEAVKFLKRAAKEAGLGKQGRVVFAEQAERGLAQFEQTAGVAGALVFLSNLGLFVGLKTGGGDFVGLKAEDVELLGIGFLVNDERGFFGGDSSAMTEHVGEGFTGIVQAAKGIEDGELFGGMKEGLMVVRAVDVHQPLAELAQHTKGGRRAVDELAVGAGGGKGALERELSVLARFEAIFIEEGFQRRAQAGDIEQRLDGAGIAAGADERAVGAFAENEAEGADDDGFAGAGFAGDDIAAGLKFESEIGGQRKVFDADCGQHVRFVVLNLARMRRFGNKSLAVI